MFKLTVIVEVHGEQIHQIEGRKFILKSFDTNLKGRDYLKISKVENSSNILQNCNTVLRCLKCHFFKQVSLGLGRECREKRFAIMQQIRNGMSIRSCGCMKKFSQVDTPIH